MSVTLSRRRILPLLAVTVAGGPLIARKAFAQASGNTDGRLILDADVCVITPETTEGPFYFDPALERRDITEGRPGLPTRVRLQIVDERCEPLPGARVDIWHCDAAGLYSGYPRQLGNVDTRGETFMRGTQFADNDGIVEFDTIYPGWYPGRTPHIHFKVFTDATTLLTGQLFFPDDVSRKVYATVAPYTERGNGPDTTNDRDGIARRAGDSSIAAIDELSDAYLVQLIIWRRTARSVRRHELPSKRPAALPNPALDGEVRPRRVPAADVRPPAAGPWQPSSAAWSSAAWPWARHWPKPRRWGVPTRPVRFPGQPPPGFCPRRDDCHAPRRSLPSWRQRNACPRCAVGAGPDAVHPDEAPGAAASVRPRRWHRRP